MKKNVALLMIAFTLGISNKAYSHGHNHGNKNCKKHSCKHHKKENKKHKKCKGTHKHDNKCVVAPRRINSITIKF